MSFTTEVLCGAQLLDSNIPFWFEKINTETLDMASMDSCILGQLFNGSYMTGFEELEIQNGPAFGFDLRGWNVTPENWALLEIAWIDAISKRIALTY